jgi:hypothetical protein
MIESILGIFLILIPFCLVFCFEDKIRGFVSVFVGLVTAHLLIAIGTQLFGVFTYQVVVLCNAIVALGSVYVFARYKKVLPNATVFKPNWFGIIACCIIFWELFSVHYFYTGIIVDNYGADAATHATYQYPYFSDEYAGIAFTGYSIRTHTLPLADPLNSDGPFTNILVGFFSVLAEVFLIVHVSPIDGYVPLAIVAGLLSCLLVYLYLRSLKVDPFSAWCAVLVLPLIVNGANLPGMWSVLPFIGGLILFIAGLVAFETKNLVASVGAFMISLILYPPMIVFVAPVALFFLFDQSIKKNPQHFKTIIYAGIVSVIAIVAAFVFTGAYSLILRDNIVGGIPSFPIWIIMPWFALPFALLGGYVCIKQKNYLLAAPLATGIIFWIAYAYTTHVLIIDYPRIVVITSFLITLLIGIGLDTLVKRMPNITYSHAVLSLGVSIVFIVIAFSYPSESWGSLVLRGHSSTGKNLLAFPASPISAYLTAEDLKLFSGIEGKRFIASPWKSLVIGAATHNYPLASKPATLTVSKYSYQKFMDLSCVDKASMSRRVKIDFIYSTPFSCDGFLLMGTSSEGLSLYKVGV